MDFLCRMRCTLFRGYNRRAFMDLVHAPLCTEFQNSSKGRGNTCISHLLLFVGSQVENGIAHFNKATYRRRKCIGFKNGNSCWTSIVYELIGFSSIVKLYPLKFIAFFFLYF